MHKYIRVILIPFLLLAVPMMALAITLCKAQPGSNLFTYVESCLKGSSAPLPATPPFVAILEPALEQDDNLLSMNTSNYRYIDLPAGKAYQYAAYNDDPNQAVTFGIEPVVRGSQACLQLSISGNQKAFEPFLKVINNPKICHDFSGLLNAIEPVFKVFSPSYVKTINAWKAITPALIQAKVSGQLAYLSVRYVQVCTGTLVSNNKVLTAAHCVLDLKQSPAVIDPSALHDVVVVGHNWKNSPYLSAIDSSQLTTKSAVVPDYPTTVNESHDFALLTLLHPIDSSVVPAKLANTFPGKGLVTKVAGFGMTEPMESNQLPSNATVKAKVLAAMSSETLLHGANTVMPNAMCQNYYTAAGLPIQEAGFDRLICAGMMSEPAFCAGDSGGPLFVVNDNAEYTLYAVVSGKGMQCQNAGFIKNTSTPVSVPGLYAPVYSVCQSAWLKGHGLSCAAGGIPGPE
ncbi:MAG: trypsin-like serine protease [Coxiellaceae bacterium]|nr:trypsin-like serine protease [Coxiellaceae bacterium]